MLSKTKKKDQISAQFSGLEMTTKLLSRIGEINEVLTTHFTKKRDLKTLKNLFKDKEKTLVLSPTKEFSDKTDQKITPVPNSSSNKLTEKQKDERQLSILVQYCLIKYKNFI